ncbi:MAG TPA: hypothetical protein ENI79_00075 [Rhodospirillales bacterium]|nr:hypothetical protein [Rhodospirillales bacterium]
MTFNAFLLDVRLFGMLRVFPASPHIEPRLKALPDALRSVGADVVCLQEVFRKPHRAFLIDNLSVDYPHAAGLRQKGLPLGCGLLTLSRYPILSSRIREFRAAVFEERIAVRMGMLESAIDLPGLGRARVINLHLSAGGLNSHPESAKAEALRVKQIAEILQAAEEPGPDITVLAGDFNSGPHTCAGNYLQVVDAGYQDAFTSESPRPEGEMTWDPGNPLITGEMNRSLPPQRIDHLFLRRRGAEGLGAGPARVVLNERRVVLEDGTRVPISDHYGLAAELERLPAKTGYSDVIRRGRPQGAVRSVMQRIARGGAT